jgi:hypothetical protein
MNARTASAEEILAADWYVIIEHKSGGFCGARSCYLISNLILLELQLL